MKLLAKKLIRSLGWDLHRFSPSDSNSAQILSALEYVQADIVFDVGANVGQFAKELRSGGYSEKIISFEPTSSAYAKLSEAAMKDQHWLIHPRSAVGDHDGEIEINVSGNSLSSSVLPMLDSHSSVEKDSAYVSTESTQLVKLDTVAPSYLSSTSRLFIKIDTQGFEWQVLDGAAETLKLAQIVLLELSLVPLYEKQVLWQQVIERMDAEGFELWAILKGFTDPETGRSLQIDGIFLRK